MASRNKTRRIFHFEFLFSIEHLYNENKSIYMFSLIKHVRTTQREKFYQRLQRIYLPQEESELLGKYAPNGPPICIQDELGGIKSAAYFCVLDINLNRMHDVNNRKPINMRETVKQMLLQKHACFPDILDYTRCYITLFEFIYYDYS